MKKPRYKDKENKGNLDYQDIAKQIIKEINLLRSDPASYIEHLEMDKKFFKDKVLYRHEEDPLKTIEGEAAYDEAIEFLKTAEYRQELDQDEKLTIACDEHCKDLGEHGLYGSVGSNGEQLIERLEVHSSWDDVLVFSLEFGSRNAVEVVMSLLVCDGDPIRSNRKALFRDDIYYIGAACEHHSLSETVVTIGYSKSLREPGSAPAELKIYDRIETESFTELQKIHREAPPDAVSFDLTEHAVEIDGVPKILTKKVFKKADDTYHIIEIYKD